MVTTPVWPPIAWGWPGGRSLCQGGHWPPAWCRALEVTRGQSTLSGGEYTESTLSTLRVHCQVESTLSLPSEGTQHLL